MRKLLPNFAELLKRRRTAQWEANGMEAKVVKLDQHTTMSCFVPAKKTSQEHNGELVLLLLHGMGSDGLSTWDAKAVRELTHRFNMVIVADLLFFGESFTSLPGRSEATQAHAIHKLLESFSIHSQVVVVGHGYGGQVAFLLASLFPSLVSGLVLVDSALFVSPSNMERVYDALGISGHHEITVPTSVDVLRKVINLSFHKKMPWLPDMFLKDHLHIISQNREFKLQLADASVLSCDAPSPSLPPLTQNALLVWGESDRIFSLEDINQTLRFLGEKAKLIVIKDAGHALPMEKPLELNEVIINFCRSLQ